MKSFDRQNTLTSSSISSVEMFTPQLPLLKSTPRLPNSYNLRHRITHEKLTPMVSKIQKENRTRSFRTRSVIVDEEVVEEDENVSIEDYNKQSKSSSSYYFKLYKTAQDIENEENNVNMFWLATKSNLNKGIHLYCESEVDSNDPAKQFDHMFHVNKKVLGAGQFGKVFNGHHRKTGQKIAVKMILKSRIKRLKIHYDVLKSEVGILQTLDHDAIVKLICLRDTPHKLFIVMEGMQGDMYELIDKKHGAYALDESLIKFIFIQILSGVHYLHSRCIVHCDLKPENVLVSDFFSMTPMAKICDFGFARFLAANTLCTDRVGTPIYSAPEVIKQTGFNKSSDMWSLGVILYVALTGNFPFKEDEEITAEMLQQSFATEWTKTPKASRFVASLMTFKKEERLHAEDCFNQPWLKDTKLINDLLRMEKTLGVGTSRPANQNSVATPILPSIERTRQGVQETPTRRATMPRQSILVPTPYLQRYEERHAKKLLSIGLQSSSNKRRIRTQILEEEQPACKKNKTSNNKRCQKTTELGGAEVVPVEVWQQSSHAQIKQIITKNFQATKDKIGWMKMLEEVQKQCKQTLQKSSGNVAGNEQRENVSVVQISLQRRAEELWRDANYHQIVKLNPQMKWRQMDAFLENLWEAEPKKNKWLKLVMKELKKSQLAKDLISLSGPEPVCRSKTIQNQLTTNAQSSNLGQESTLRVGHVSRNTSKAYILKLKRARNAYQFWQAEKGRIIADQYRKTNGVKLTKRIAQEWRKLKDKSKWEKMASDEKEVYKTLVKK